MEAERRNTLEGVMGRLIGGDLAMVWALSTQFGSEIARVIRRHLRTMGRIDVIVDPGRVEGLVIDVALWFHDHGSAYDPAASLPWVWADRPIAALVAADVGHRSIELDSARLDQSGSASRPAGLPTSFEVIASVDSTVQLLVEAVREVGSERDVAVHLEYRTQQAFGDPSPSHTVGSMCGLQPANVRQIDRRMRQKLTNLASSDSRFLPLKELAWLA